MRDPAGYTCEVCSQAGTWRVSVGGEIDLATVPVVEAVVQLAQADALTVWLDLHDVLFMDSSGIAMLTRAHRRRQRTGNDLVLVRPSAPVRGLLDMCGIDRAISVEDQGPWTPHEWGRRHAVIATDLDGAVLYWNRDAEALYGYAEEQTLGRPLRDLIVDPRRDVDASRIVQALKTAGRWQGAFDVARADGSTFRAWVRDIVIRDDEGRPQGLVGLSVPMLELSPVQSASRVA
jgi:anti-anti-sigma factor